MGRTIRVRRSRTGRRSHLRHLYRGKGTEAAELRRFREEYPNYSETRVRHIYGATVGKVKREREAARRRRR